MREKKLFTEADAAILDSVLNYNYINVCAAPSWPRPRRDTRRCIPGPLRAAPLRGEATSQASSPARTPAALHSVELRGGGRSIYSMPDIRRGPNTTNTRSHSPRLNWSLDHTNALRSHIAALHPSTAHSWRCHHEMQRNQEIEAPIASRSDATFPFLPIPIRSCILHRYSPGLELRGGVGILGIYPAIRSLRVRVQRHFFLPQTHSRR